MTDDELKELVASLAIAQRETREQMKETDERMRKTDEKLERIGIHLGNITANQGDVAEEFFFNSLVKDMRLGNIRFEDVMKNLFKQRGKIQEEYDLIMTNGDSLAIIEVKYKAHQNDLVKLARKMHNFKKLFPIYQNFKQYGAIASFHINDDAKKEALERGYFVLQRQGELIHSESSEHLTIL